MNIGIIIKIGNDSVSIDVTDNKVMVNNQEIKFNSGKTVKGKNITKELRVCANELCGKSFAPTGNRQEYCCRECRPKNAKPTPKKEKEPFCNVTEQLIVSGTKYVSGTNDENSLPTMVKQIPQEESGTKRLSALKKLRNKFIHPLSQINQ